MGLVVSLFARLCRLVNGICFLTSLVCTALVCCILLIPVVLTVPLHSIRIIKLRRYYTSAIGKLFFDFAASYLLIFGGTKLFIYCNDDRILHETSSVILMSNHRTRYSLTHSLFHSFTHSLTHLELIGCLWDGVIAILLILI